MLVDLSGRTKESTKYIEKLGIQLYDTATGRAKELPKVLDEVLSKLSTLNQRERNFYMHKILTERGIKPVSAVLGEGMGEYNRMKAEIADAQANGGYARQTERRLNETSVSGQWRMVQNSFESESIQAFSAAEASLIESLKQVREELNSGGITSALTTYIELAGKAALFTAKYGGAIAAVAGTIGAYGALKIAAGGFALVSVEATRAATHISTLFKTLSGGTAASATAATATAAVGASAVSASVGLTRAEKAVKVLRLGLMGLQSAVPIVAAVGFGLMLLHDAATTSASEAVSAIKNTDYQQYATDLSDAFQKVHKSGKSAYEGLTSAGGQYAVSEARSVADVIRNYERASAAAEKTYVDMKSRYSGSMTAVEQDYLGRREQIVQDAFELGKRLYDGTLQSKNELLDLAQRAADEEVRIEREKIERITRLNAGKFAENANKLIKNIDVGGGGQFVPRYKTTDYSELEGLGREITSAASAVLGNNKQLSPDKAQQLSEFANFVGTLTLDRKNPQHREMIQYRALAQALNGMQGRQAVHDTRASNTTQVNALTGTRNSSAVPQLLGNSTNNSAAQAPVDAAAAEAAAAEAAKRYAQTNVEMARLEGVSFNALDAAIAELNKTIAADTAADNDKQQEELKVKAAKANGAGKTKEETQIIEAAKALKKTNAAAASDFASKNEREAAQRRTKEDQAENAARIGVESKAAEASMALINSLGEQRVRQQYAILDALNAQADAHAAVLDTGTAEEKLRARNLRAQERALELAKREVAIRKERMGDKLYTAASGAASNALGSGANTWFSVQTSDKARREFEQQNGRKFSVREDVLKPAGAAAGNAMFGSLVNMGLEKLQLAMRDGMRWMLDDQKFGETTEEAQLRVLQGIYDRMGPGGLTDSSNIAGAPPTATEADASGSAAAQAKDAYKGVGATAASTAAGVSANTAMMFGAMTSAVVAFSMRGKSAIKQFAAMAVIELLKVYMMQRMVGAVAGAAGGAGGAAAGIGAAAAPAASGMSAMGLFAATAAGTAVGGYLANKGSSSGSNSTGSSSSSTVMQSGSVSVGTIAVEVNIQSSGGEAESTGKGTGEAGRALGIQMAQSARAVVIQMARSGELLQLVRAGN
jgi:hypothetical protein